MVRCSLRTRARWLGWVWFSSAGVRTGKAECCGWSRGSVQREEGGCWERGEGHGASRPGACRAVGARAASESSLAIGSQPIRRVLRAPTRPPRRRRGPGPPGGIVLLRQLTRLRRGRCRSNVRVDVQLRAASPSRPQPHRRTRDRVTGPGPGTRLGRDRLGSGPGLVTRSRVGRPAGGEGGVPAASPPRPFTSSVGLSSGPGPAGSGDSGRDSDRSEWPEFRAVAGMGRRV